MQIFLARDIIPFVIKGGEFRLPAKDRVMAIDDQAGKTGTVRRRQVSKANNGANLGFENKLWEMADKMRVPDAEELLEGIE